MTTLFDNLKNVDRKKIINCRDFKNGIFLNRAERVEQFDENILKKFLIMKTF